jgi:hypothetical protein
MHQRITQLAQLLRPAIRKARVWVAQQYLLLCRHQKLRRRTITALVAISVLAYVVASFNTYNRQRQLGEITSVFVASQNLEPGDVIDGATFSIRRIPRTFVAPSALRAITDDMVVQQRVAAGDVLSFTNVGASSTPTDRLPQDFRAVAIALRTVLPNMQPGNTVDVIANGVLLAADGLVLYVLPESNTVVVAVPSAVSPAVASAAAIGDATLVVSS